MTPPPPLPPYSGAILTYFNDVFIGVCRLIADVDNDVKNGAALFDRLLREIVVEAAAASPASNGANGGGGVSTSGPDVAARVVPLIRAHMGVFNPYVRQWLIGWITALDSVPGVDMLDHLGEILEGLFDMLSDGNREVRHAAHSTLAGFLGQIDALGPNDLASRLQLGAVVGTLLAATERARDRFVRATAFEWLAHFIALGRTRLSPWYPALTATLLLGLSDPEPDLAKDVAKANTDLMLLVRATPKVELETIGATGNSGGSGGSGGIMGGLLRAVRDNLSADDRLTRSAALRWLSMLLQQAPAAVNTHLDDILGALLANLVDTTDVEVLKLDLEVIARLAATDPTWTLLGGRILRDIVRLFGEHRTLLESKAAFILRRLCLLLDPAVVYRALATLVARESNREFAALLVELLNLILLTSSELADLRDSLRGCAAACEGADATKTPPATSAIISTTTSSMTSSSSFPATPVPHSLAAAVAVLGPGSAYAVYTELFAPWTCNPVAAISLALLAHSHELAARLVGMLAETQITVGLLMQVDKLVQLLESPIFLDVRLALLAPPLADRVTSARAAHLLTALFGLLMVLPQGTAYATLRDRLTAATALLSVRGGGGGGCSACSNSGNSNASTPATAAAISSTGRAALETKFIFAQNAQRTERDAMSAEIRSRSVLYETLAPVVISSSSPTFAAAAAPEPSHALDHNANKGTVKLWAEEEVVAEVVVEETKQKVKEEEDNIIAEDEGHLVTSPITSDES